MKKTLDRIFIDGLSWHGTGIVCNVDHWDDYTTDWSYGDW